MPPTAQTAQPVAPAGHRSGSRPYRPALGFAALAIAALAPAAAYFLFVAHYGVNSFFWDDWSVLPVVDQALHGHLTLGALWAQHNEERLLVPNLIWIVFAFADHLNLKSVMYFDATLYTAGYLGVLALWRRARGQLLSVPGVFAAGLLWFGVADYENALWGFQLSWFLIAFLIILMMLAFVRERISVVALALAALVAIAASFSSLQGLLAWPIGLLWILWRPEPLPRKVRWGAGWAGLAVLTTTVYLWTFNFGETGVVGGKATFGLHHPLAAAEYFLVAVGSLFPTISDLALRELLGGAVFVGAGYVFVAGVQARRKVAGTAPFPVAPSLIMFGVLFDMMLAVGRTPLGLADAESSRYTMANLMMAVGVLSYFLDRRPRPGKRARGARRQVAMGALRWATVSLIVGLQVASSTAYGLTSARQVQATRILAARIVVNLAAIPPARQPGLVTSEVFPSYPVFLSLRQLLQRDRLGELAPGARRSYLELGPP